MSDAEALDFLEHEMVAHVGVIDDGKPYVTPMSFALDGRRLLFRTKPGRRFEAIESNSDGLHRGVALRRVER